MKITTTTIELTPEDLRQTRNIIAPRNTLLSHQVTAPATLMESARKLNRTIEEARAPAGIMPRSPCKLTCKDCQADSGFPADCPLEDA